MIIKFELYLKILIFITAVSPYYNSVTRESESAVCSFIKSMSVGSYNIWPNRMYIVGVGGWTDRVMTWHPVHGECEALIATIVLSERNAHNWLSGLSLVVISLYVCTTAVLLFCIKTIWITKQLF